MWASDHLGIETHYETAQETQSSERSLFLSYNRVNRFQFVLINIGATFPELFPNALSFIPFLYFNFLRFYRNIVVHIGLRIESVADGPGQDGALVVHGTDLGVNEFSFIMSVLLGFFHCSFFALPILLFSLFLFPEFRILLNLELYV